MTKEELLNLDNKEYFISSLNIIDKDKIKNIEDYMVVEEEIITTQEVETERLDEESHPIFETVEIKDTILYIAKKYKEGENWMSVQKELFI